jgi:hypothetical protein
MILKASANTFKSFSKTGHVIRKRVSWYPKGITCVKTFIIEPCIALPNRELVGIPISEIKQNNPKESNPFSIQDVIDDQHNILENKIDNLKNSKCMKRYMNKYDPKKKEVTIFSYKKGEMSMWCE